MPCVATGNVHAHARSRVALQDAFVAARLGTTLDESEPQRRGNTSHVLASPEAMAERFPEHPEAVLESGRLAERLEFDLTRDLGYRYPGSEDGTADRRLAELCSQRARGALPQRRARGWPPCAAREARVRLEEELRIIRALKLSGFFLLHRDMLELAREVAVEVRGTETARRAAAARPRPRLERLLDRLLPHRPLAHRPDREPAPDGPLPQRGDLLDAGHRPRLPARHPRGADPARDPALRGGQRRRSCPSFACYRTRGAVRDFAKALGLPPGEIERAARSVDPWSSDEIELDMEKAIGGGVGRRRIEGSPRWQALVRLVQEAHGLPRHVSQHPGGMVIATEPLCEICPIQPAAMTGRQIVQWDKDSCSDAGFLKIDLLGLGMLSAVERCVDEIARVRGERIDLSRIPFDDPQVYRSIQQAKTTGVFQIESRAQMQMLVQTLPETLDDLTVQVALVRPGPILGGAVHPYIERRKRLREDPDFEVPYEHPSLEPVLRDTLGTIVFQDQVIEVAMAFAGFSRRRGGGAAAGDEPASLGGGDARLRAQVRRGSGGARRPARVGRARVRRRSSASRASASPRHTRRRSGCWPTSPPGCASTTGRSSSAGCSTSSRWASTRRTRWCTRRSGAAWRCCRRMSCTAMSSCRVEPRVGRPPQGDQRLAVRIGLGYVLGVREADVRGIVDERERGGPFGSLADLAARCAAQGDALERLAWAGACDSLCSGRREALWLLGVSVPGTPVRGGTQLALPLETGDAPSLRDLTPWERMLADYGSTHVTLQGAPAGAACGRACPRTCSRASSSNRRARAAGCGSRASWWPASGRPPRTASPSCCSRTSSARST